MGILGIIFVAWVVVVRDTTEATGATFPPLALDVLGPDQGSRTEECGNRCTVYQAPAHHVEQVA